MVDIQKQIDYWINSADDDIITADLLIHEKRILHGLFFCHLVIEKAIKAHYVKTTGDVAPRTHNLINLSEGQTLKYDIHNGIKTTKSLNIRNVNSAQLRDQWPCVTSCVNSTMNDMSWGTYVICIATLPECAAGVFLGCELDCSLK